MANVDVNLTSCDYGESDFNNCVCLHDADTSRVLAVTNTIITALDSEFGVDIDVLTDIQPSFVLCGGYKNMGNAIARRLMTPAGSLADIGDDPDYGYDIRGLLNADMTADEIKGIGSEVEKEIMKEDRVQSATVTATYSFGTYELAMEISILLKTGVPLRLVLGIGTATVEVIDEGIQQQG